jgi:hypothetical protein
MHNTCSGRFIKEQLPICWARSEAFAEIRPDCRQMSLIGNIKPACDRFLLDGILPLRRQTRGSTPTMLRRTGLSNAVSSPGRNHG